MTLLVVAHDSGSRFSQYETPYRLRSKEIFTEWYGADVKKCEASRLNIQALQ